MPVNKEYKAKCDAEKRVLAAAATYLLHVQKLDPLATLSTCVVEVRNALSKKKAVE